LRRFDPERGAGDSLEGGSPRKDDDDRGGSDDVARLHEKKIVERVGQRGQEEKGRRPLP